MAIYKSHSTHTPGDGVMRCKMGNIARIVEFKGLAPQMDMIVLFLEAIELGEFTLAEAVSVFEVLNAAGVGKKSAHTSGEHEIMNCQLCGNPRHTVDWGYSTGEDGVRKMMGKLKDGCPKYEGSVFYALISDSADEYKGLPLTQGQIGGRTKGVREGKIK